MLNWRKRATTCVDCNAKVPGPEAVEFYSLPTNERSKSICLKHLRARILQQAEFFDFLGVLVACEPGTRLTFHTFAPNAVADGIERAKL